MSAAIETKAAASSTATERPARVVYLRTPAVPCFVDEGVFDGYGWCASQTLEWRCPATGLRDDGFDPQLPVRMAFVLRKNPSPVPLPVELAKLHAGRGYALGDDDWALAPYAIDDATDELYAHRVAPNEVFWLAADNVNALYWALHDWAHFHNHGPFDDVTATEWQCDLCALTWMALNLDAIGLSFERFEQLCVDVVTEHRARTKKHQRPLADGLLGDARALADFAQRLAVAPGP